MRSCSDLLSSEGTYRDLAMRHFGNLFSQRERWPAQAALDHRKVRSLNADLFGQSLQPDLVAVAPLAKRVFHGRRI